MNRSNLINAHLLMIMWSVLIATSFPAADLVSNKIEAASLTALRFLCASILFFPIVFRNEEFTFPSFKEVKVYALLSLCLVFYFWSLFKGLETTVPMSTSAIFTLIPAITAFFSYFILGSRVEKTMLCALTIGFVGSCWVVIRGDFVNFFNSDINRGDLIFLAGCTVLALYSPLIQFFKTRGAMERSAAYITFWVMCIGTALLVAVAFIEQGGNLNWLSLTTYDYGVIIYLAVFTTIITFWQIQYCTPILGPVIVMSYTYLIPSIVLIIDKIFFQQAPDNTVYYGVAFTLASLLLLNLRFGYFKYSYRKLKEE